MISLAWPIAENSIDDARIADLYSRADAAAPWLRANFVASADGAATRGGLSGGLSSGADKRVFDILRTLCDAVLLGAGTLRDEGYGPMVVDAAASGARVARGLAPQPTFAIVSRRLELDPASPVFTEAPVRPIVVTTGVSPEARREALAAVADVLVCGDDMLDVPAMVAALRDRGLGRVLCEGGPALFGTLLAADVVDELCLTVSPQLTAGSAMRIATGSVELEVPLELGHVLVADGSLILRYTRAR